jgi:hypothetical protein
LDGSGGSPAKGGTTAVAHHGCGSD